MVCPWALFQVPADGEEFFLRRLGFQFPFDLLDEALAIIVDLVLSVEEGTAAFLAVGFEGFDLLLAGEFFLKREGGGGCAAGFFDLAVDVFDFAFEADLQVVGPVVELGGLGFEELGIALGDVAADAGLLLAGDFVEGRWRGFGELALVIARKREEAAGGVLVEGFSGVRVGCEDEVVLGLVEGIDGVAGSGEPAGLADEGFEDRDLSLMGLVAEGDLGGSERAFLGGADDGIGQGMPESVEVGFAAAPGQLIAPEGNLFRDLGKGGGEEAK